MSSQKESKEFIPLPELGRRALTEIKAKKKKKIDNLCGSSNKRYTAEHERQGTVNQTYSRPVTRSRKINQNQPGTFSNNSQHRKSMLQKL